MYTIKTTTEQLCKHYNIPLKSLAMTVITVIASDGAKTRSEIALSRLPPDGSGDVDVVDACSAAAGTGAPTRVDLPATRRRIAINQTMSATELTEHAVNGIEPVH